MFFFLFKHTDACLGGQAELMLKHYNHWSLVGQMGGSEIKVNLFTGGEIRDKRVAGLKKRVFVKRVVTGWLSCL